MLEVCKKFFVWERESESRERRGLQGSQAVGGLLEICDMDYHSAENTALGLSSVATPPFYAQTRVLQVAHQRLRLELKLIAE